MSRVQKIQYKGKEIIYVNHSRSTIDEMLDTTKQTEELMLTENKRHLLLINISDAFATTKFMVAAKNFGKNTQHLTDKSAIVGISGVKALLLRSYNSVAGAKLKAFETEEEAKEYLVQ